MRQPIVSIVSLFFLVVSAIAVPSVHAQQILMSDNFDDGVLDGWTVLRTAQYWNRQVPCANGSQPAVWEIVSGWLQIEIFGSSCVTEIAPTELDLTDVESFQVDFDWRFPDSLHMDRNALILWQDTQNWYGLKILDDHIAVQKVVAGKSVYLLGRDTNFMLLPDRSYHFTITYTPDRHILIEIDGQQVIDATDYEPFLTGWRTLGFQGSVGAISYSISQFDNIVVRDITPDEEPTELAVPFFKQTDPAWREEHYDTAQEWSQQPTIGRWGCAMTSLAMVMNFHGLTTMPDGQPLNPSTLNAWLQSQPDGYVGAGLTNWLAGTRLSRILSSQLGTPKLEYSRVQGDSLAAAAQQIELKQPVILDIPGHFAVGSGLINGDDGTPKDLRIKDPAYDYSLLSQHQTELLSTRILTPSQTDLSYWLFAHRPGLDITLTDAQTGQTVGLDSFSEWISDPVGNSGERTPDWQLTQKAKPDSGMYTVKISQAEVGAFELQFFSYDTAAEVSLHHQAGWVGQTPLTFEFDYHRDGQSQLTQTTSFTQLRAHLKELYQTGHLTKSYAWKRLDRIAAYGQATTDASRQARLLTQFSGYLKRYQPYFSADGLSLIERQTELLAQN